MKKCRPAFLALAFIGSALFSPAHAANKATGIQKCQDETGRWHYGDMAAEECSKSKITVINKEGITKKEIAPPPSASDLKAQQEALAKEQEAKERAKQDELLLSTYAVEADILYVRDRKLAQIDASIKASEDTLKSLRAVLDRSEKQAAAEQTGGKPLSEQTIRALEQTRAQIATHENAIEMKRKEGDTIRARAEVDLARYRELKNPARTSK